MEEPVARAVDRLFILQAVGPAGDEMAHIKVADKAAATVGEFTGQSWGVPVQAVIARQADIHPLDLVQEQPGTQHRLKVGVKSGPAVERPPCFFPPRAEIQHNVADRIGPAA